MWSATAMQDIKMRYRGSMLGPFWLTTSMVVMIAAMGLIYVRMFTMEIDHDLPFLTHFFYPAARHPPAAVSTLQETHPAPEAQNEN